MILSRFARAFFIIFLSLTGFPGVARAAIIYDISFNDPGATFLPFYDPIRSHIQFAGSEWAKFFAPPADVTLSIQVVFRDDINRSSGRSFTSEPIDNFAGRTLVQDSAAFELAMGIDSNGAQPDIEIGFQPFYLANELSFDLAGPVAGKTDALTVIRHELAHALGFNGFRNILTGEFHPAVVSTYDALTILEGGRMLFVGTLAEDVFGGPVPLTFPPTGGFNTYHHLGLPGDPASVTEDLMNGIAFFRGIRYEISDLDVAILGDIGIPLAGVPFAVSFPATVFLVAGGTLVFALRQRFH